MPRIVAAPTHHRMKTQACRVPLTGIDLNRQVISPKRKLIEQLLLLRSAPKLPKAEEHEQHKQPQGRQAWQPGWPEMVVPNNHMGYDADPSSVSAIVSMINPAPQSHANCPRISCPPDAQDILGL